MNYFIVSKGLDDSSLEYLGGILSSIMDLSEGKIHNLSSDSEAEIAGMKIEIRQCRPKVIISLGAEASRALDEKFKYVNSSRGKLSAYIDEGFTTKIVVTYSPKFLLVSDANMEKYGPVFLQDLEYAVKYVKGELVDIAKKNLQYARTFADFKKYFDEYLKDAKLPAYDIETNAKDTRSAAFRIIGYSLAPNGDTGIYVVKESLEYKMPDEDWKKCVDLTKEYISSHRVLVHNIMYERPSTLNEWGVNITNFEDSLIKSRLLLGGKTGAGLKQQCAKNLGYPDWDTDLHVYLTCLGTLRDKLKPTPMGKVREDYTILKEQGFASLLDVYTKKVNLYTETLEKCKGLEPELISKEDKTVLEKGSLDNREGAVKEALETLAELIGNYYDNPAEILELAAKEAINLIDIQHEGIIPYSSVPMNIITKYGALDSIGTQDLNDYLDRRIEKDSTAEVDLHRGYKVLKANYLVGTEMELYGLYWNDEIAENIRVWLSEKAYEAMIAMLQSGFLDDNIFEKSRPHLLQYVKEKEQDKIREILGEFDVMKSGIKLKASGKRITWNQLLDQLGESFIQSHYQQIVEFVKSDLRNKESYPNYEAFTELFNPSSNAILGTLQRIFMSVELKVANALNEIVNVIKAGIDLESLPNSDRVIYECYLDKVNYNNKIDSGEIEGTKIPAKAIFESMSDVIKQRIISQSQKQSFSKRSRWGKFADNDNSLDKILENACLKYEIKDTSEPTIVSIYNNLTVMGCDIEDESTWTEQFRFLINFRTFKKCIKLINVYIDGDKIGRGSVWVVNKQDILDRNTKFAPRKRRYTPDIKEDETYLMQATWGVCFTGDTKIKCLNGSSCSFKELVEQNVKMLWVYAVTKSGNQIPAQATDIRLTRKNAKLVEVELDSGAKIKCTPDHLFMLRSGRYKKAESLTQADELMSVRCGVSIQDYMSHRAFSVVPLDYTEDVYDLTVIGYSNFALDCGVFVHNCTAATLRWRGGVHTLPAGPMVKGIYTSRYKGGVIAAPDYCLTGDTKILLLDNTKKCLSELEGVEEFFVYSYDEKTKKVVVGRGHDCRIVRTVDETVKLTFDDNSSIECSADHTFMKLSEQKFVKAEDLSVGDTIQTLQLGRCEGNFRRTKDNKVLVVGKGRLEVENLDGSKTLVQALANDWNLANEVYSGCDKPMHIHHKDENPDNNDPRNLAYITGSQHNRNHAKEQWSNTERLYNGQTFREKMTEVATKVFAPLRLGINKNPVNIEKRRQGNLKVHEARFAQGLEVMLQHYSAEELAIRFNYGRDYDSKLRTLLGVTRLPKGMGYRTLNSLKTTFIGYLENLSDNPITKKNLSLIGEIRAKLPANGVSGQDLFKAITDHNLSLERFEDSRQYLVQNNLLPSNNHVTLSYVEKAFGSIENFYLWHTYFADTYITGYRSQNPLKVMLSSNTEGQVTEAKVYDHKSAYSRLSYRVYFTDNEFLEVAPGQRIRTASGVYKYPEELGGYSVMSHYLKETENNTVKVAKYDPSLSRAVVKIEKVFYPASVEFEHFSIDRDHNYLVPVYADEDANNLNVVLHNDSQHRYITKIERLKYDTPKELYCFTVDHYHNFFTGHGVLTHQSQQEIRTISGLANCQSLLDAYRNGEDVHMKTAMSVFKKPKEEITKNERRFCKSATFAILYGSTVAGLANLMSVPMEQAQQMMDGFFGAYPELKVWMDARHSEIDRGKKVSCSKVGYFLDIDSNGYGGIEEAYKQAGNYPVQGQSSLIAGYVLNSINQYFVDNHMMTKPISFIHDSLEFDIHPSELFIACQKITSMMNDIPNAEFGIPSKAELTIGMSMGDENEVTHLEEHKDGGIIELQGYENDLDAILENWRSVYSSVEYKDDLESVEEIYVPRKEIFMPKLTISKYSGTIRKMVKRRFVIKF